MAASDDFNRADDTNLNGDALSSGGATWVQHASFATANQNVGITSNTARQTTTSGLSNFKSVYYTSLDEGAAQFAQADFTWLSTSAVSRAAFLICRCATGAETYYVAFVNAPASGTTLTINLYEAVAGSFTQLGSDYTMTGAAGTPITLRLEVTDARKEVFVNGASRVADTTHNNIASGRTGLGFFDNFGGSLRGWSIDNYTQGVTVGTGSAADTVTITDTASRSFAPSGGASDTLTITDTASPAGSSTNVAQGGLIFLFAQGAGSGTILQRTASDSITITDAATRSLTSASSFSRTTSDTLVITSFATATAAAGVYIRPFYAPLDASSVTAPLDVQYVTAPLDMVVEV